MATLTEKLAVACRKCGALRGHQCTTKSGAPYSTRINGFTYYTHRLREIDAEVQVRKWRQTEYNR